MLVKDIYDFDRLYKYKKILTVFPHIDSAETNFFLNLEIVENSNSCRKLQFFT